MNVLWTIWPNTNLWPLTGSGKTALSAGYKRMTYSRVRYAGLIVCCGKGWIISVLLPTRWIIKMNMVKTILIYTNIRTLSGSGKHGVTYGNEVLTQRNLGFWMVYSTKNFLKTNTKKRGSRAAFLFLSGIDGLIWPKWSRLFRSASDRPRKWLFLRHCNRQ